MDCTLCKIHKLLNQLGVTANYAGFFHLSCALVLCVEDPERLLLVTKWLYPEVARQRHTSWQAVERNLRTAGDIIWRENRPLLEQLARRPLTRRPSNAQLLSILCEALDGSAERPDTVNTPAPTGENDIL